MSMRKKKAWLCASMLLAGVAFMAQGSRAQAASPGALVVFGDSFSDTGLVWRALAADAGENVPYSPPYFEGRFSNGPVAVEHMAEALGVTLDSRAWGGARSGEGNILGTRAGLAASGMASQVRGYVAEQLEEQPIDAGTLHVLWAGANDLIFRPNAATARLASGNIVQAIDTLYAAGARSFFVPLMPDLALSPMLASDPLDEGDPHRMASLAFNAQLLSDLSATSARLSDARIVSFDTLGFMRQWLSRPEAAGVDATHACVDGDFYEVLSVCADPDKHVYWDGTHFSARMHEALGTAFAASVVPEPAGLALMGWGLFALSCLLGRARRALGNGGGVVARQGDADAGAATSG